MERLRNFWRVDRSTRKGKPKPEADPLPTRPDTMKLKSLAYENSQTLLQYKKRITLAKVSIKGNPDEQP